MNAATIIRILSKKHENDVFVSECKSGPTVGTEHDRLDGWAMRKSWSNPLTFGYEVKVSRTDFLRDDKWHRYRAYCNELYFVCPRDLIKPNELPDDVGLLYVASTGERLFTKKKAHRREVTIPEELFRYVLICRARIDPEGASRPMSQEQKLEHWRKWLVDRKESRELGWKVRQAVREMVLETQQENARLKEENESLAVFRSRLKELGVLDPTSSVRTWHVDSAMRKLAGEIPRWLPDTISGMERGLKVLRDLIEEAKNPKTTESEAA
jgi:hypothetical protein